MAVSRALRADAAPAETDDPAPAMDPAEWAITLGAADVEALPEAEYELLLNAVIGKAGRAMTESERAFTALQWLRSCRQRVENGTAE